jgi:hypothetical protein
MNMPKTVAPPPRLMARAVAGYQISAGVERCAANGHPCAGPDAHPMGACAHPNAGLGARSTSGDRKRRRAFRVGTDEVALDLMAALAGVREIDLAGIVVPRDDIPVGRGLAADRIVIVAEGVEAANLNPSARADTCQGCGSARVDADVVALNEIGAATVDQRDSIDDVAIDHQALDRGPTAAGSDRESAGFAAVADARRVDLDEQRTVVPERRPVAVRCRTGLAIAVDRLRLGYRGERGGERDRAHARDGDVEDDRV